MTDNPTTAPVATTEAEALEPCPMCRGKIETLLYTGSSDWAVECRKCGMEYSFHVDGKKYGYGNGENKEAKRFWNTRADAQQPQPVTSQSDDSVAKEVIRRMADSMGWVINEGGDFSKEAELIAAHREAACAPLRAEVARLREALEMQDEALQKIVQWSEAYPLDIFPEPDFKKAHAALQSVGMTLDGISGSVGRRMADIPGSLAKQALASTNGGE